MRVSHLAAVATLVALLSAMFVALPSVSAADLGPCATGEGVTNVLKIGDSCSGVSGTAPASTDEDVATVDGDVAMAEAIGMATIQGTAENDEAFMIEVVPSASIAVAVGDSDSRVSAGTDIEVWVTGKAIDAVGSGGLQVTLSVPSTGMYFVDYNSPNDPTDDTTSQRAVVTLPLGPTATMSDKVTLSTTGAPVGEYVITARYGARGNLRAGSASGELQVGDPGTGLNSATLSLAANETASAGAPGTINLVVEAFNSLEGKSNDGDVNQVIIFARGGATISIPDTGESEAQNDEPNSAQIIETDTSPNDKTNDDPDDVGQKTAFSVSKDEPGTVAVSASVIGNSGDVSTETLTLTFTGPAQSISLGEPSDNLKRQEGEITIEVTAKDEASNAADVSHTAIVASLKDADGNKPKNLEISDAQKFNDKNNNGDKDAGEDDIKSTVVVTVKSTDVANAMAEPGVYTVEVTMNNDAKTKQTVDVIVVGTTNEVSVESTASEVSLNDIITVTAMVTDANGAAVTDKTKVMFSTFGELNLQILGGGASNEKTVDTKAGIAMVQIGVSSGSGGGTIVATSDGVSGTVTLSTAAVEEEAMPAPEMVGNHCIENKGGFAVWTCGVSAMASEVFALVQPEGATAIHLWSTISMSWVRYSVVDGTTVPGSSDFMVTENSILYISN